jgi:hypothetical protein
MKALFAAAAVLLAASSLAPLARAEGPRPSSENNWPGMTYSDTNVGNPVAATPAAGPRPSSENNWPGMTDADAGVGNVAAAPQNAAPHYVWQEGYDHGGKWHGHWVLIQ